MQYWLILALFAQCLNAVVALTDKYIVTAKIGKPIIYAFYVGILSSTVIVLLPFGVVSVLAPPALFLALGVALSFFLAILLFYESLHKADASDVVPAVAATGAVTAFILGHYVLREILPNNFVAGTVLLILGTVFLSHFRFTRQSLFFLLISGVLFGVSSILTKALFIQTSFLNGFFWTRMAIALCALTTLLIPGVLEHLKGKRAKKAHHTTLLVIGNKLVAALATFLTLLAIERADVSLVNALGGVQFVFLFIFAILFAGAMPNYFHDRVHKHEIWHKALATALIVIGFGIYFI